MDLSFDLQLFAVYGTETNVKNVHLTDGLELSGTTFTLGKTSLSVFGNKTITTMSWVGFNYSTGTGKTTSFTASYLSPKATATAPTAKDALVAFAGGTNAWSTIQASDSNMSLAINDTGTYTWKFAGKGFDKVTLGGTQQKLELSEFATGLSVYIGNAAAKNYVKFTNSNKSDKLVIQGESPSITGAGALGFENGQGTFSLVSGTSLAGNLSITGGGSDVLSLTGGGKELNVINLKSNGNGTVVLTGASFQSDVNGMKKVTYTGLTDKADVVLTTVKSSAVVIGKSGATGSTIDINIAGVDSSSSVTIGGKSGEMKGSYNVSLSGSGRETIVLDSVPTEAAYTTQNWLESTGDTTKGNVISLTGSIKDFTNSEVTTGTAKVKAASTGAESTFKSTVTNDYGKLGVNIAASEGTYSALLVGTTSLQAAANTNFSKYNYIIGKSGETAGDKTLDLGDTSKKVVFLANEVGEANWNEASAYKDVTTVKSSSVGNSLIISGLDKAVSLAALGSNDSVWSGGNNIGDNVSLKAEKSQILYSGANDGLDTLNGYDFGASKSKANAVRFLDGVTYIAASAGSFTVGSDSLNAVQVSFNTTESTGNKVAYGFGLNGEKYVAAVDATTTADAAITYESDVNAYFGQGDSSSVSITSAAGAVKLGWDGGAGAENIGTLNGKTARDGSVIVGTGNMAQSIVGSDIGASSISGGFVREEWTDSNNDTLIGGAKATTFFVGGKMGNDEITGLTSNDNIVFLGTKYADCTKTDDTTSLSFVFSSDAGGARITAETADGKNMSALKNVSLYFDDTTLVWDGKTWSEK